MRIRFGLVGWDRRSWLPCFVVERAALRTGRHVNSAGRLPLPFNERTTAPQLSAPMQHIQLDLDNTYYSLYSHRVRAPHEPLPSVISPVVDTLQTDIIAPEPLPSLTQPTDFAPIDLAPVNDMPFRGNDRPGWSWGISDPSLIVGVIALGIFIRFFNVPRMPARGLEEQEQPTPPTPVNEEPAEETSAEEQSTEATEEELPHQAPAALKPDVGAISADRAGRTAMDKGYKTQGYEGDREDN